MQMSDFTIRVKNLPRDNEFKSLDVLKGKLWNHFQDILHAQFKKDFAAQNPGE